MQLKARVEECITIKCDPMKTRAEAIAKRLGLNNKGETSKEYITDPKKLVEDKTWTMSEVADYQEFEECFNTCQKPIRMF